MKINNFKNQTIELYNIEVGDVFELGNTFFIKTNETREHYTICINLLDGSFAYFTRTESVLPVEAYLNICS